MLLTWIRLPKQFEPSLPAPPYPSNQLTSPPKETRSVVQPVGEGTYSAPPREPLLHQQQRQRKLHSKLTLRYTSYSQKLRRAKQRSTLISLGPGDKQMETATYWRAQVFLSILEVPYRPPASVTTVVKQAIDVQTATQQETGNSKPPFVWSVGLYWANLLVLQPK